MSFSLISRAYAACQNSGDAGINLGDCLTLRDGKLVSEVYDKPAVLINLIVRNLFVVAGLVLFFLILFAGYKFIQGGSKGKDEAKGMMEAALIGFIIMFSAFWAVQLIRIVTGADLGGF